MANKQPSPDERQLSQARTDEAVPTAPSLGECVNDSTIHRDWRHLPLGDVITLQRGFDLPSHQRKDGMVPIISSSGRSGLHAEAKVKAPGVVTGRYGTIGQVFYITEDFWPLNTTLYVKDFKGNDPKFVSYLLRTIAFDSYQDKGAVPGINRNHVHQAMVDLPPPTTQRAIARILGTIDDKIDLNHRENNTLEAIAQALFQSWFMDFDPVHDKAQGREPRMSGPIPTLFPDSFSTITQHEIPSGWGYQSFASTVDIIGGGTPKTSVAEYWGGDIPWFSVVDAPSNSDVWVVDTQKRITLKGVENSSTQILPVGTTIISARGTVGRVALVGVPMAMNQSCYGLRGLSDRTGAYTYFRVRELVASLQQHAHGSVFDTITRATLESVGVVAPPKNVIKAFEDLTEDAVEKIRANLLESASLTKMRDLLLPGLLSGAVDLSSARLYLGETEQ